MPPRPSSQEKKTINISLPVKLINRLDYVADQIGATRSSLISQLAIEGLGRLENSINNTAQKSVDLQSQMIDMFKMLSQNDD